MKHIVTVVLTFLSINAFMQEKKHSVYIATNENIAIENSLYIDFDDPDFEVWSEPKNNFSLGAGYTYNLTDNIGIGLHVEFEKIEFEEFYLGESEAKKVAFGLHFQVSYPVTALHGLAGGNFNFGRATSDDFDNNLKGIEYGVFLGPEYSIMDFDIGLLFHGQFSYFFSGKESPQAGLITYPRVSLRIGYSF